MTSFQPFCSGSLGKGAHSVDEEGLLVLYPEYCIEKHSLDDIDLSTWNFGGWRDAFMHRLGYLDIFNKTIHLAQNNWLLSKPKIGRKALKCGVV